MSQSDGNDLAGPKVSGQRRLDQWKEESEGSAGYRYRGWGWVATGQSSGRRTQLVIRNMKWCNAEVCSGAVIAEREDKLVVSPVSGKRGS